MTFFSSVTIALRPAFMRSASAMSSGDARSTCGVTSVAILFIVLPQLPTPKDQFPTTPDFRRPTPNNFQLGLGVGSGWQLELVVGSSFALSGPNFSRLQCDCGDQLLEFRRILRRVHALLEQPQRLDATLEI